MWRVNRVEQQLSKFSKFIQRTIGEAFFCLLLKFKIQRVVQRTIGVALITIKYHRSKENVWLEWWLISVAEVFTMECFLRNSYELLRHSIGILCGSKTFDNFSFKKPLIICSKWTRMKIAIGVKPDLQLLNVQGVRIKTQRKRKYAGVNQGLFGYFSSGTKIQLGN